MTKIKNKYDLDRLQSYCNECNVILLKDYENVKVTRDTKIEAFCLTPNCNNIINKTFKCLINNGGCYCVKCCKINSYFKIRNTSLERYGVEHYFQNKDIIEKRKQTCLDKYGVKCSLQYKEIIDKRKRTNLEKYGVENPNQCFTIMEKRKKTCLDKYGVEYSLQSKEIIDKRKKTNLEKYGVEYVTQNNMIKEKVRQTCLNKYGVDSVFKNKLVIDKIKKTCLDKYGVEYPCQNPNIADKAFNKSYISKVYIMPSGKEIKYQGYENFALNEIIDENIEENDIITGCKNVPKIYYSDENGKKHCHFVDIFIKSQNKCIEVKSTWTINNKKSNIFLKQNAAKKQGYNYEIWVYNSKGEKVEIYF